MFDPTLCVICQIDDKSPLASQKTGHAKMRQAAKIRRDVVEERIRRVMGDDKDASMFVYHNTNTCYKFLHTFWQTEISRRKKCKSGRAYGMWDRGEIFTKC